MSLTWPTPSLPILNAMDPPITEEEGSWLASLVFIGAIIASPVFSYISQNYGRKIAGYCTVIPFSISWLLVVFFDSIPLYYISRFLGGFASGGVLAFCPMYIGEIAEDSIRGTLGTVRSMVVNIGAIIFCAVGPLVSLSNMAAICTVVPIIFAVCFLWLPESPMYLMKVGKVEEAKEAMTWLRGGNVVKAEEDIRKLAVVVEKSNSNVSFKELLSSKGTRRGLVICIVLAVAQQLSGVSAIMSFSVSLFESAGGLVQPTTASIIMTSVQLFGTIIASIFLDIAGRRILLIGSQITMTLSLGTLGTYFYLQELNFDLSSVGFVPMVCAAVYVLSICVGLITVSFVVMAEIFSPESRGLATSITTTIMWFMAFLTTRFYASIVNVIGLYGCYWFFALVCVASNIFTILKIPETKNRSLESILLELNGESAQNDVEDVNQQKDIKVIERY
ncbi:Facilitated trehalose transporter Tret1 [Blattella germanica]|nr:Facilitated trehalose transporter Tret1 [Blattella germanica]